MGTLSNRKQIAPDRMEAAATRGVEADSKTIHTTPTPETRRSAIDKNHWREEVAGYAVQNGVSAAARQFQTTRKTVRLWMKRLNKDVPTSSGSKEIDFAATLKDTTPAETTPAANIPTPAKPVTKERKAELLALNPSPEDRRRRKKATPAMSPAVTRRSEPFRSTNGPTRLLQIEVLSLVSLPGLASAVRENSGIPAWQVTALDIDSGAAWVAFSHQLDAGAVRGFIRNLTAHWERHGLSARNFSVVLNPKGELLHRLDSSSLPEIKEIIRKKFAACRISAFRNESGDKLGEFHTRLARELYAHPETGNIRRFLDTVHAYILRNGYERKLEDGRGLPPYQILSRLEGGRCHEGILNLRPPILDKSRRPEVPGLVLCKNILTGLSGLLFESMKTHWQRLTTAKSKPAPADKPVIIPRLKSKAAAPGQFVSLKNISWKSAPGRPSGNNNSIISRNRAEVISQAREMLAQNMADADLKATLPITEAELALIRQSMNLQNRGISR